MSQSVPLSGQLLGGEADALEAVGIAMANAIAIINAIKNQKCFILLFLSVD
jgi:hypothetical protein